MKLEFLKISRTMAMVAVGFVISQQASAMGSRPAGSLDPAYVGRYALVLGAANENCAELSAGATVRVTPKRVSIVDSATEDSFGTVYDHINEGRIRGYGNSWTKVTYSDSTFHLYVHLAPSAIHEGGDVEESAHFFANQSSGIRGLTIVGILNGERVFRCTFAQIQ